MPALTTTLGAGEDDLLSLNLCSQRRRDRRVTESDLERVRESPFVVADTVFLGLLRETGLREVGLVAEVSLEGDPDALLGPRADQFESKGFEMCEATPEAFAKLLLRGQPIERFAPLGAGAITFSLLRRFSRDRVESALSVLPGAAEAR